MASRYAAALFFGAVASHLATVTCMEAAASCVDSAGSTCPDDSVVLLQTSVQVHSSPQKAPGVADNVPGSPNATTIAVINILFREIANMSVGVFPPVFNDRPPFYHLHISKAAGSSFLKDAAAVFWSQGHNFISREGCFYNTGYPHTQVSGVAVLVRNPRKLVLSQFNYMNFDPEHQITNYVIQRTNAMLNRTLLPRDFSQWIGAWLELRHAGWAADLTVPPQPLLAEDPQEAQSRERMEKLYKIAPYWMPTMPVDFDKEEYPEWFGGGTGLQGLLMPFGTWSPLSFQAQRLTCTMAYDYSKGINAAKAVHNLKEAYFSGVVEAYQTSVCLLYAKVAHTLPAFCDCTQPDLWATFNGTANNMGGEEVRQPEQVMSVDELSPEVLAKVDELVQEDWEVYRAAWDRLVHESREVEQRFGMKILCDETMPV